MGFFLFGSNVASRGGPRKKSAAYGRRRHRELLQGSESGLPDGGGTYFPEVQGLNIKLNVKVKQKTSADEALMLMQVHKSQAAKEQEQARQKRALKKDHIDQLENENRELRLRGEDCSSLFLM